MHRHVPPDGSGDLVEVIKMGEEDAISLLLKAAKLYGLYPSSDNLREVSKSIVTELCFLPLAIDQAGAAIASGICHINDYLQLYSQRRAALMKDSSFKGASDYGRAVYGTWSLSFKAIQARAEEDTTLMETQAANTAILILDTFAFLHHEHIMEEIFERAAKAIYMKTHTNKINMEEETESGQLDKLLQFDKKGGWDVLCFREGIRALLSVSFIKQNASEKTYSMHPLVHSWSRDRMSLAEYQTKCHNMKRLLTCSITEELESQHYAFCRALLPHIKAIYQYAAEVNMQNAYNDDEYTKFGLVFLENGYGVKAEKLFSEVVEARKTLYGMEHSDTLRSVASLALSLSQQGQWEKAEELQVIVMETRKRVFGEKDPLMLISMSNLFTTFASQHKWEEAFKLRIQFNKLQLKNEDEENDSSTIPLFQEVLKPDEQEVEKAKQLFGAEHPMTLVSINILAASYWNQEKWKEAEELYCQVVEMSKRILGQEHPDTLVRMGDLASTYWRQGRLEEAEKLQIQTMNTLTRVLGAKHPSMLRSMNDLAHIYGEQSLWEKAEELCVQVVDIKKKTLGAEHPQTLSSMTDLANVYKCQEKWKETEELNLQTIRILGPENPFGLSAMLSQVSAYKEQERWKEAEELLFPALELMNKLFGPEYAYTVVYMAMLALIYSKQKEWKKAEKLGIQVVELRKKIQGLEHTDTLRSMENLASAYREQEYWQEAMELQAEVVEIRQRLDEDCMDTLTSMVKLAYLFKKVLGEDNLAMDFIQQAKNSCIQKYGADHQCTKELTQTISEEYGSL